MKKPVKYTLLQRRHQDGAALIVGLLLLVVITVMAVSGMNTATTELAMARNNQTYENTFQAAESGLESALAQGQFTTGAATVLPQIVTTHETVATTIQFEDTTLVPDAAFSLGAGSGISAYHFQATSQAQYRADPGNTTTRDASATHTQAFYVVGPSSNTL